VINLSLQHVGRPLAFLKEKQRDKQAQDWRESRACLADKLSRLLTEKQFDELGVDLHHILKHYPSVRAKWLAGDSLISLLNERQQGTLFYSFIASSFQPHAAQVSRGPLSICDVIPCLSGRMLQVHTCLDKQSIIKFTPTYTAIASFLLEDVVATSPCNHE
jgi:hypothetical protein